MERPTGERCEATFMDDSGWHLQRCARKGRYEEQGKHWCKQHLPSLKRTRGEERSRQWQADFDSRAEAHRRAACFPELVAALEGIRNQVTVYPDGNAFSRNQTVKTIDNIAEAALAKAKN